MNRLLGYLAVIGLRLVDLADDFGDWVIAAGEGIKGRTYQLRMSLDPWATPVDGKALCDECGDRLPYAELTVSFSSAHVTCRTCEAIRGEAMRRAWGKLERALSADSQGDEERGDE